MVLMRLWAPKVDFGSFSQGSGGRNEEKDLEKANILHVLLAGSAFAAFGVVEGWVIEHS